jgi:F-type H+-transporting ATPase subunit delta
MAENTTIARPYAEAVFDLARGAGQLAQWSEALERLAQVAGHPQVAPTLNDPALSDEQRVGFFLSLAGEAAVDVRGFLATLAYNGRLGVLPEIRTLFEALKNASEGVVQARIETAYPLAEADLQGLIAGLERRFSSRVQAQVEVDPALIGGVRIRVGDEVIESSVRSKLSAMSASLTA